MQPNAALVYESKIKRTVPPENWFTKYIQKDMDPVKPLENFQLVILMITQSSSMFLWRYFQSMCLLQDEKNICRFVYRCLNKVWVGRKIAQRYVLHKLHKTRHRRIIIFFFEALIVCAKTITYPLIFYEFSGT